MRKTFTVLFLAFLWLGCQPKVLCFKAKPSSASVGPVDVELSWRISAGGGTLSSDQPVTPSLVPPISVSKQGSKKFEVCETTTFKLEPSYGGERTVTVNVGTPCDAPGPCGVQVLNFTGTCPAAGQGPVYGVETVAANVAPGNLTNLLSNADFPIHVIHAGADIALGAGGGPIGALPVVPAAGDYQIYVPGQVGINVCEDAGGPVGGGQVDAPPIQLTVAPTCPKP